VHDPTAEGRTVEFEMLVDALEKDLDVESPYLLHRFGFFRDVLGDDIAQHSLFLVTVESVGRSAARRVQ